MKKRGILAVALAAAACGGIAVWAAGGSAGNPLIAKSYLDDTYVPGILNQAQEQIDSGTSDAYNFALEEASTITENYTSQYGTKNPLLEYSASFSDLAAGRGDTFTLSAGGGFLLRSGSASVAVTGTVIDVSDGTTVSGALLAGHRYLVAENSSAAFRVTSLDAVVAIEGSYGLQKSVSELPFTDVGTLSWYYDYVVDTYRKGLFKGESATLFAPEDTLQRCMAVTVLYRMAGTPAVSSGDPFADVSPSAYYADAVAWAYSVGITKGMSASTFGPENNVTREQLACFLYNYAKNVRGLDVSASGSLSRFPDGGNTSSWALDAVKWAVGVGILSGSADNGTVVLRPQDTATRAQAAKMLQVFAALS